MTAQQEVILLQLLQKLASEGDHTAIDLQVIQALSRIAEKLDALFELLSVVHARLAEKERPDPLSASPALNPSLIQS